MTRRFRLTFLALSLLVLLGVGRWATGSFRFFAHDFWFTAGLLLLVLLSMVDQPHFSKDANVFLNGITGWIALLIVPSGARDGVWTLFFAWSGWLILSSYVLMLVRRTVLRHEPPSVQLVSRVNRQIGRPEALFSGFFLWGVWGQFRPNGGQLQGLLLFWAVFMILNLPEVSRAISGVTARQTERRAAVGNVRRLVSPRVVELSVAPSAPSLLGKLVQLVAPSMESVAKLRIVSDRTTERARFARGVIEEARRELQRLPDHRPEQYTVVVVDEDIAEAERAKPLAFVSEGSHIGALHFDLDPDMLLSEGELAWVLLPNGTRAYYQIVGARVHREDNHDEGSIHAVHVEASQLGTWQSARSRFEPITWVAPPGGVVYRFNPDQQPEATVPVTSCQVGTVPNSEFPVHIDIDDAVTQNCAIIGVTGSGKSYLAFHYIEDMVHCGLKVLILDLSRQHWVFLRHLNPTPLRQAADVDAWLESDNQVGIHQFAGDQGYPETTRQFVARVFQHVSQTVRLRAGRNEPARICVVFEEAHSLIPEWNQVTDQRDKDRVNATARMILQGRKFGLGCLVITQRTANVTKTILNQCNTIFALQSFDQTGLDFLRNYMGEAYARAMASLPVRHAILVGKASSSTRPILFAITDFTGRWMGEEVPTGGEGAGDPG